MATALVGVIGVIAGISLGGEHGKVTQSYPAHPKTHVLVEVRDVPFLIPKGYFHNARHMKDGAAPELGLHASLPDIDDDGAIVAEEVGFGRHLRIGVFPPALYTTMTKNRLYTEQIGWNRAMARDTSTFKTSTGLRNIDFRKTWNDFVEENRHKNDELLSVSHIFGWSIAGAPPEQNSQNWFVIFLSGRLVMDLRCAKPVPGKSPGCWSYYHHPGDRFAINLIFALEYLPDALAIAKRVRARLASFNVSALALLGKGETLHGGDAQ